jgi:hypothetical protein
VAGRIVYHTAGHLTNVYFKLPWPVKIDQILSRSCVFYATKLRFKGSIAEKNPSALMSAAIHISFQEYKMVAFDISKGLLGRDFQICFIDDYRSLIF